MGLDTRPAACSSCGKRLTRKHWFYRNGAYFCKRRCWETEQSKKAEGAKGGDKASEATAATGRPAAS